MMSPPRCSVRAAVLGFWLAAGCHGIEHPAGPASASPILTPTAIVLVSSPPQLPIGGGTAVVHVSVVAGVSGISGATVALAASTGELAAATVVTDVTGHATVEWRGDRSSAIAATLGELATSIMVRVTESPQPPGPGPGPGPGPEPGPGPAPPAPGTITVGIDGTPSPAYAGEAMRFTAYLQVLPPVGGAEFAWDFTGDGVTDATTNSATWTFATAGSHTATVAVTTPDGRRGDASIRFTVRHANELSVVSMTPAPTPVAVGEPVTWSASIAARNASLPALTYHWDLGGNGTVNTTGPTTTTVYMTAGKWTARVTATASDGRSATGTGEVTVTATTPK